jgi:hypothetical protein
MFECFISEIARRILIKRRIWNDANICGENFIWIYVRLI